MNFVTSFLFLNQDDEKSAVDDDDDGGYLRSGRVSGGLWPELFSGNIALSSSVSINFFIFPICKKKIYISF